MKNPGHDFRESPNNKMFTVGNIITCPNDGSNGAEWRITDIDKKGNIHAELIDKTTVSRFYVKNDTIVIIPQAYDDWDVVAFE